MTVEQRALEILKESYPSLNEGHFNIMRETLHPLWCYALTKAEKDFQQATKERPL